MASKPCYDDEAAGAGKGGKIPERSEIDAAHTWNVEAMYADDEAWEEDFARIDELAAPLEAMRGRLDAAEAIAAMFEAETALDRLIEKLYVYAHLRADEDTANTDSQGRLSRIRARFAEIGGRLAWITPEILSHSEAELREWTDAEALAENRYAMVRLLRRKPHTLSEKEETLLARAGEIFGGARQTFGLLTNADMRFPDVEDAEGQPRELSQGRYISFLLERDRRVRRDAFNAMYDTYGSFRNTIASTFATNVKHDNYMAKTRAFPSALEASLHDDNVPLALYETLLAATHDALPYFHDYVELRREQLGLDDLDMWDMYVPIVPAYDVKVPYDRAREWVVEACRPLGEEYVAALSSAFDERWLDVYENRGKRSGAYSSGCYDSLPYALLNYQDTLDDVFTLAHELGHSMHSWLANHTQPHRFADAPIFIAEIPSTLNEGLLLRHLLGQTDDPRFRAYLLNHLCDSFKGTVYRQTMFAEFEKKIHEMDAEGRPLTPDAVNDVYYGMNAEYYGSGVKADERIGREWMRIPHFYSAYYVYKYATSFCASQIFVGRVVEDGAKRDRYLDLLRAGGSADPIDLIAEAGVDMTDRATLDGAFATFGETVRELRTVLGELDGRA